VFRRCLEETLDVAAAREVFTLGAHDDHAHALVFVERFEGRAQLVACVHRNHVKWRPMQNDVGALAFAVDLDRKAVEFFQQGLAAVDQVGHGVTPW
jgi:hypothetical protein